MGGREAQQFGDFFLVGEVLGRAFLEHLTEGFPERRVLLWLVFRLFAQHVQHALGERAAQGIHGFVLLQDFPRHVQGQIFSIEHTFDEAQVQGQELLRVVHDKGALYVQFDAALHVSIPQVKGRAGGDVQQAGVFEPALDAVVTPGQRVFEIV